MGKLNIMDQSGHREMQFDDPNAPNYADGTFNVIGGLTGHRYRIDSKTFSYNVKNLENDLNYCFGPREPLPNGDRLLAQKLAIELHEEEALKIANVAAQVVRGMRVEVVF